MPRQQVARSAEPRQVSHCRRSVEPGNVRAAPEAAMRGAGSPVMRAMKWEVPLEGQMEVDRAGQKRKNAQREAHQETEKIKIRPGHKSPRARRYSPQLAVAARELEFEIRTLLPAARPPRPARLSCEVQKRAADGRCPSVVLHSDDCRDAKPLQGALLNPASGEFPPGARSHGESLRAPR